MENDVKTTDEERKARRPNGMGSIYTRPRSRILQIAFRHNGHLIRESAGTTSVKKAGDKLKQRLAEVQSGTYCGPQAERTMVSELIEDTFRDYRVNSKKSLSDAETRWKLHLKPFFGLMRASEVTKEQLKRYVDHRQKQAGSNASINRELALLKRAFNLGVGDKVLRVPKFPHLQEHNIRTGFLEDHEYEKLATACSRVGLWMRALFETGYRLGWRISELLNLTVGQVDLLNRIVRLEPGQTKNGEGRTAPITDRLSPWLQQCCLGKDADRYVFSRDSDGVRRIGDFRGTWAKVTAAAGVPNLLFHDLRRTCVRNMTRASVPERVAMSISGHLTRSVFDRYDIVSEADLHLAAERMNTRQDAVHSLTHTSPENGATNLPPIAEKSEVLPS